jgi:hypothetical protein
VRVAGIADGFGLQRRDFVGAGKGVSRRAAAIADTLLPGAEPLGDRILSTIGFDKGAERLLDFLLLGRERDVAFDAHAAAPRRAVRN